MSRHLGDWQTPAGLSASVFDLLACRGVKWSRVLEPTCGTGSFVTAALAADPPPEELWGIDIQAGHLAKARAMLPADSHQVRLLERNIFEVDLGREIDWATDGPLLVVGNPPWVTNAELGSLGSDNLPKKSNIKRLSGLDAITGSANFDIAESITLKLISELASQQPTIALLLKTTVARNVLRHCHSVGWPVAYASIHRFDAKKSFGAAVDACLVIICCGGDDVIREVPVFGSLSATQHQHVMGFTDAGLVANVASYRRASDIDGRAQVTWRQGVKHDAALVMELEGMPDGLLTNRLGEQVEVEPEHIFPLIKSTQLNHGHTAQTSRRVILPQRSLTDDTFRLRNTAPELWAYLKSHQDTFDARRSSIYRGKPPFAIFGVGDYTFTDYKIAVSGLHKQPRFRLVGPIDNKPVIFDDTSYMLACDDATQAAVLFTLLTCPTVAQLLRALMFPDSKRPVTKRLLQRVDLLAVLAGSDKEAVLKRVAERLATLDRRATPPPDENSIAQVVLGSEHQLCLTGSY